MVTSDHLAASVLATELAACGLRDVVLSPGSRHAPLVLAFHHEPRIRLTVALDERSAGHIALGMAVSSARPAAVICTSGTAAVNHGPAIAEAFHQGVPLISITADRPAASRNRGHGQSVVQPGLFTAHVMYEAEVDERVQDASTMGEMARQAWSNARKGGPVHLNVPFEEPLYGLRTLDPVAGAPSVADIEADKAVAEEWPESVMDVAANYQPRILVLAGPLVGEGLSSTDGDALFDRFAVVAERSSQLRRPPIASGDLWLAFHGGNWPERLVPDLVLTVGGPTMSKALRLAVDALKVPHVHVGQELSPCDIWGRLIDQYHAAPAEALVTLAAALHEANSYAAEFQVEADRFQAALHRAIRQVEERFSWSDLSVWARLAERPNPATVWHWGNSTAVRYAQLFDGRSGSAPNKERWCHVNRGAAGIDGTVSTAVGDALSRPEKNVWLVLGDLSMLYDLNGLMVDPLPSNLTIVVLNNGGGNIFRWLGGPAQVGLVEPYFQTPQLSKHRLVHAAALHGLQYFCATDNHELESILGELQHTEQNGRQAVLCEVITNGEISGLAYEMLLKILGEQNE